MADKSDLTRDDVADLRKWHAERLELQRKIADDVAEIKRLDKMIGVAVKRAGEHFAIGAEKRTRFGVRFRLVTKAGRVAWKSVVERLKGQEFVELEQSKVPPVTVCEVDIETL